MNWSKIKNIMIIILAAINLFLIIDIGVTNYMSLSLPRGTGENFKTVLQNRGIDINEELIPGYYERRASVTGEFYDIDYLTKIFIKSSVNYTSNGQSVVARQGNNVLTITGTAFEYTNGEEMVQKKGRDIIKALKKIGIETQGAVFYEEDGLVKMEVDGCLIDGMYLDVSLSKKGEIAYLKGVWPKIAVSRDEEKVSVISVVNRICSEIPPGSVIDNIEKMYFVKTENKKCIIVPGWKITADGINYTFSR